MAKIILIGIFVLLFANLMRLDYIHEEKKAQTRIIREMEKRQIEIYKMLRGGQVL